jgi:rubrerythrin
MLWLKPEVSEILDHSIEGLRRSLQIAIELEHSTIPPYLYALYSLKPGCNQEIAKIIRSVVLEEMLHMSLVCNVLNAVGGSPSIDSPRFIPEYPTELPGTVEKKLCVGLERFSLPLLTDVFMVIEQPETPLDLPVVPPKAVMLAAVKPEEKAITIGEFYDKIIKEITHLAAKKKIFTGDPARQLRTTFGCVPLHAVTDEDSALKALGLIVDQGEGTLVSPLDIEGNPAHYYRYQEIWKGYTAIKNPEVGPDVPPYIFGGTPIPFDEGGVWPVIRNPGTGTYPEGSPAARENRAFNQTYTELLKGLHRVFNGEPDRIAPALLNMQAMHQQAAYLMSLELGDGQTAGPTFQYDARRHTAGGVK